MAWVLYRRVLSDETTKEESLKKENDSQWVIARSYRLHCEAGDWARRWESQGGEKGPIAKRQTRKATWIHKLSNIGIGKQGESNLKTIL